MRKYLALPHRDGDELSNQELADKAYNNDLPAHDAERLQAPMQHFICAGSGLSQTGVTRQLLWREYLEQYPDGYSYGRYCYHLNQYLKQSDLSMHLDTCRVI